MPKGMVLKGLVWESSEAILWSPYSTSLGLYHMTSDMPGEERSEKDPNCMTSDIKGHRFKPHGQQ